MRLPNKVGTYFWPSTPTISTKPMHTKHDEEIAEPEVFVTMLSFQRQYVLEKSNDRRLDCML